MNKDVTNKNQSINKAIPNSAPIPSASVFQYSSPLPPPEVLAKYRDTNPGLIDKVIEMSEKQADHRREIESRKLLLSIEHTERKDWEAKLGQTFAFILSLFAIGIGSFVVLHGYSTGGALISSISLGTIIPAFIYGRRSEK